MDLKRFKVNLGLVWVTIYIVFISPSNIWGKSLDREEAIRYYNDGKTNDLVEQLAGNPANFDKSQKYYLLAKAFADQGQYQASLEFLDKLSGVVIEDLKDLEIAERIEIQIKTKRYDDLLKLVINEIVKSKNPYLLAIIAEELTKNHGKYKNLPLLRLALAEMIASTKKKERKADLSWVLYNSYPVSHPKRKEILVNLWVVEDVNKLTQSELKIVSWMRNRHLTFMPNIVEHFKYQKRYKNYTYSIQRIPEYFPLFKDKNDPNLKQLTELYFYSLQKKRQYSHLISLLKNPQKRSYLAVDTTKALDLKIRLQLRKGNPNKAKEILGRLQKINSQYDSSKAYLAIGDYYFQRGQFKESIFYYRKVNLYKPNGYSVSRVKWQLWRAHYRLENTQELKKLFDWSKSYEFDNQEIGARFCYWSYKINIANDGTISQCYEKYPLTYYGLRAKDIASNRLEYSQKIQPLQLYSINKAQLGIEDKRKLSTLKLLYSIGEDELADSIVRKILPTISRTAQLAIADLLLASERYYMAQYIVESGFRSTLEESLSGRNLLLPYFYPKAFQEHTKEHSIRFDIPETLILSVMREESHFNPEVESYAGAIGLMQLMPKTASYIGKKIGLTVKKEELVKPNVNITLGSAYLKRLLKRYKGNLIYTLAAYNGGPTNVRRWQKKVGSKDIDDFVESITFIETQNYVRRVMRSYYLYQLLYGQES